MAPKGPPSGVFFSLIAPPFKEHGGEVPAMVRIPVAHSFPDSGDTLALPASQVDAEILRSPWPLA